MGKVDRFMLWMSWVINPSFGTKASQQRLICDEFEKRYPVMLVRAEDNGEIGKVAKANADVLFEYLKVLEEEEKVG